MNAAKPDVFCIMDYWTFDGWFALKHRLSQPDSPTLNKIVFPGIELRLVAPMKERLNAHVIFSNEIDNQLLKDFKSNLKLAISNTPLSNYALRDLARSSNEDILNNKGYKLEQLRQCSELALEAGSKIAEITYESYREAVKNVPKKMGIGYMPFDTNDGLASVKWAEHYSYCLNLFDASPIFETRNLDKWAAFSGIKTEGNKGWYKNFQAALRNTPRLAVSGSDAHRFVGVEGDQNRRGYGDFPSEKITWIKADLTFRGLQQAIKEPANRSYIGKLPPKKSIYENSKSLFLDRLSIDKLEGSALGERWLENTNIPLNHDLVAIIGNKGSGKSLDSICKCNRVEMISNHLVPFVLR